MLIISSTLAALEIEEDQFIFYLASFANGIQNGISSIYSEKLIRSTGLTGTLTDIGIFLGQHLRGNRKNTWKLGMFHSSYSLLSFLSLCPRSMLLTLSFFLSCLALPVNILLDWRTDFVLRYNKIHAVFPSGIGSPFPFDWIQRHWISHASTPCVFWSRYLW